MTDIDLRHRNSDPLIDAPAASHLEMLADELGAVDAGTVPLLVDARPGWSVLYSLGIDGPTLAGWRRACRDDTMPTGVDEFA